MIPFVAMAVMLAVSFSLFLFNTFVSFRDFHQRSQSLSIWDTMTLASTNRVVRETNSFLASLSESLLTSIKSYDPTSGHVDSNLNNERISLIQDYLSKLDLRLEASPLKHTIEFGLSPFDNKGSKNYSEAYTATLVHSEYIPVKLDANTKSYASSLLTDQQTITKLSVDDLESKFINNDTLRISSELLTKLLDTDSYKLIESNPGLFNIEITDAGLNLNDLPNGIEVNVTTSVTSSQT